MEGVLSGVSDELIPGLHYKLPSAASFIKDRRSATFHPEGAASYSPSNVRVLRFTLADASVFVDPQTVALSFDIRNNSDSEQLTFLTQNPLSLFSRLRILCGGTLVEDISYYGRLIGMLDRFKPFTKKEVQLSLQGFLKPSAAGYDHGVSTASPIGTEATRKVVTPIECGLFGQHAYIGLKWCPITIELELASDAAALVAAGSSDFTLSNCRILADTVMLDGAMEERISKHLLSGRALPLHLSSWSQTMNVISPSNTNGSFSVVLARAYSRAKTFVANFLPGTASSYVPTVFSHPMTSAGTYDPAYDTMEWQLSIGAKLFPETPVRSLAESAYHLVRSLNLSSSTEALGFAPQDFGNASFFMMQDLEKAANHGGGGAFWTGMNTRGGDLMRFEAKNINCLAANVPTKIFMCVNFDVVVEIKAEGVSVYD